MIGTKESRQALIRELITNAVVPNQDVLQRLLGEAGYTVTQSSVSRDLADLGVVKEGGRYVVPAQGLAASLGIVDVAAAGPNLLVFKTATGAAPLAGVKLDALNLPGIVGTISGDDTIFVATPDAAAQNTVLEKLGWLQ